MALARRTTRTEPVPHEPGASFDFRLLNFVQLESARKARTRSVMEDVRNIGPELFNGIQNRENKPAEAPDLLDQYDTLTVLLAGIAGWTYPEPVTAETVADLDETTAGWAKRIIVGLTDSASDKSVAEAAAAWVARTGSDRDPLAAT